MRIPGLKTLKLSARWLRSRFVSSALILGYHRVADAPEDPYSMCVSPKHFAEHLEALRKHANPLSLHELVSSLTDGNIPRRAVVITFDDGYADNLYHAKPLLEHYEIPATTFVLTGNMGGKFWWDELARIVMTPMTLPETIRLNINDRTYEWSLDHVITPTKRQQFLLFLSRFFLRLPEQERQVGLEELRYMTGVMSTDHPLQRALRPDEVINLADDGLVEIGAHTNKHPVLAAVPITEQEAEIRQSKSILEEFLGQAVTSFSYPNGSSSAETSAFVRKSGFTCACSSFNDMVRKGSDLYNLPRFWIPDRDGVAFSRWLKKWLHD